MTKAPTVFAFLVLANAAMACGDSNANAPPPATPPASTAPPASFGGTSMSSRNTSNAKPASGGDVNVTNATTMAYGLLKEKSADLRTCYEKGLINKSSLAGQITVRFLLTPAGQATSVAKESSSLNDEDVEQCVIKTILNLSFSRFEGKAVTIVYPIEFQPSGSRPGSTSK